jgi:PilZ domain-containing protein
MSEVHVGEWSGVENRRHKRVPLRVDVECRQGQKWFEARGDNVSISGLLVRCTESFAPDTEITVSFTLPGAASRLRLQARVAHIVPGVFMGLELLKLSEENRAAIERYVEASAPIAKSRS